MPDSLAAHLNAKWYKLAKIHDTCSRLCDKGGENHDRLCSAKLVGCAARDALGGCYGESPWPSDYAIKSLKTARDHVLTAMEYVDDTETLKMSVAAGKLSDEWKYHKEPRVQDAATILNLFSLVIIGADTEITWERAISAADGPIGL